MKNTKEQINAAVAVVFSSKDAEGTKYYEAREVVHATRAELLEIQRARRNPGAYRFRESIAKAIERATA